MITKSKIKSVKLTRNQRGTLLDSLSARYEFLLDFGTVSRNERKQVSRLMRKIELS
jgi:hypothetical protein